MEEKKNQLIKKIYYDPEQGFQNADKLFAKIKNDNELNITKADITRFIKSQVIDQVYKKVNGPKKYNSYRAWYPSHIFQIDIVNYQRHEYKGDAYILTLIDVYSRYACARAMPNRKMETIIKNYNSIMEEIGPPYILQADNEFNKKEFLDVLKKDDVKSNFFQANEVNHNAVIERFNYTLTNFLKKIRTLTKNKNWVSYLQKAMHNYNNSIHSTTKNTPYDVYNDPDIGNEQKYVTVENSFKINDAVKIILKKKNI
jgi:transposase InsO family protein